ncbi:MAG: hypothetical protein AB1324_01935 [Candidatus Micrarchaeota archaeon]
MIFGGRDGRKGKGCSSPRKRIFFIRLDRKGRLVLPLEIQEAIRTETDGKILLSVSAVSCGRASVSISKAPENAESCAFNGSYLRKKEV